MREWVDYFQPVSGHGWDLVISDITEQDVEYQRQECRRLGIPEDDRSAQAYLPEKAVPFLYKRGNPVPIMPGNQSMRTRHNIFMAQARGDVLLTGLGFGMIANAAARLPQVNSVTVVEIDKHLVRMMQPQLLPKVKVEIADAWRWTPRFDHLYDVIWHDIWSELNIAVVLSSHLDIMGRYGAWLKDGGWQSCFEHGQMLRYAEEHKNDPVRQRGSLL